MKSRVARVLALLGVVAGAAVAAAGGPPPGVAGLTPTTLPPPAACRDLERRPADVLFVGVDYLLTFPRRGNMDYAIPDATNDRAPEGPIRRLDMSASSGVRALAGWRPGGGLVDFQF